MDKKKAVIIIVIVIFLCSVVSIFFNLGRIKRNTELQKQAEAERLREEAVYLEDCVAPVLILSQDKLVSYKGDEINYLSFVKSATDNLEGDLKDKVIYNEVDINEIGEYDVIYEVQDRASNTTLAKLHVIIREKPNFKY